MNIMGRVFYIFIFIFFIWNNGNAEEIIHVSPEKKEYDLTSSALLCIDRDGSTSINTFLKTAYPKICKTVDRHGLPFGYTQGTIWFRTKVQSSQNTNKEWIAEVDNALLDYIDLYVIKNGKVVEHFKSGDKRPFSLRPIKGRTYRFPIRLSPETTELIWKIRSQSGINLPLKLYQEDRLDQIDQLEFFIFGFFYGILFILGIYNFSFFVIFKRRIFFYYVAFIFSYTMMEFSFDGFTPLLVPDLYWLYNEGVLFFVNLCILFSILFGQRFLETSINAPKVHRFLNILIIIDMIPLTMSFFDLYSITSKFVAVFSVITPILLLHAIFAVMKKNKRRAKLYLLAWSLFFAGTILFSLHKLGLIQSSWFIIHAQQIGVLFTIMVLSYALGDQLQSLLYIDQLTGLGNRHSIERIFNSTIHYAKKEKRAFAVLTIDIDDFKTINDSLTHKVGDKLLQLLTQRLKQSLRTHDTMLRMGQDEFLIILENISTTDVLTLYADNILMQIRKPFTLNEHIVHITASMGIALYPNDGLDYETLMKNSDSALHKAKELGHNRFHFFNPNLDNTAVEHLKLYNDLFGALENQELFLLYQPKINTKDNTLAGVEVLIRWDHPERGIIPPNIFIKIAEDNEIILRITRWMLEESFKKLRQWHNLGWKNLFIAANITAKDLHDKYFIKDLFDLLKEYHLTPDVLELELTERIMVNESKENIQKIKSLHDVGIKIAIDDFGTGYSTFNYLRSYQVNAIKIDKSFIDEIETSPKTAKIVKAMTMMGHELGMKVVAEGVENKHQAQMLKKMNCDVLQGYYFDKPLTEEELTSKYFQKKS